MTDDNHQTYEELLAENRRLKEMLQILQPSPEEDRSGMVPAQCERETLRAIIESLPFDVFAIGADGRCFMQNAASIRKWGNKIGTSPAESTESRETVEQWLENNRRAFSGETVSNYTEYVIAGERRFVHEIILPIKDAGGNIFGILGINIDQTEQKRAEENLRMSEEKFATAFRLSPDSININRLDDGTYVNVNDGFCAITGYSPEEVIGKSSLDLGVWVRPEDRERLVRELKEHGYISEMEAQFRKKDGSIVIGVMSGRAIVIDGVPCVLNISRDITDRKKAEEALLASEAKFRTLFDKMQEGFVLHEIVYDDSGLPIDFRIVDANPAFERIAGLRRSQVLGRTLLELFPGLDENWLAEYRRVAREGTPRRFWNYSKGFDRYFDVHAFVPAKDRLAVIFSDVTEQKKLQDEIIKAQKLESLGLVAGGIAHDFNNLLTGILGNLSFARTRVGPDHPVAPLLEESEKAAVRAADLTRQLLTFAKGGEPVKKVVSLSRLVSESASFVLRGSNVDCSFRIEETAPTVDVDEGQISQVVNNLIINAAQSMPDGGTVNVAVEECMIFSQTGNLEPGAYVKLTIADKGCGIPEKDLMRIFDPYFSTKPRGTGLGLTSAYSIVKRHRGHLEASSRVGEGSTFSVYLPASAQSAPATEAHSGEALLSGGKGNILVMDDEEMIRTVVADILEYLGYKVCCCADGMEAIRLYQEALERGERFDAVVMDLTIPGGMGGKEAATEILRMDPQAKMIVSSGYSDDPIVASYREYGFSAAVVKPYAATKLAQSLDKVLKKTD